MTYRLAFNRTIDGYLKISATAKDAAPLTATLMNPDILLVAARIADLSDQRIEDLNIAAKRAWSELRVDVCCEAIELQPNQLETLGFVENWQRLN